MSFADVFKNPWFMLFFALWVVFFTGIVVYGVFIQVTEHRPFCESVGLEYDGFANRKGSMINCSGISNDYKAILKTYLLKDGKYYEVSDFGRK